MIVPHSKKILIYSILITAMLASLIWSYRIEIFGSKNISSEKYISSQMQSCYNVSPRYKCLEGVAHNLLSKYKLPEILKIFDLNEKKPEYFENCHNVTHLLGQLEYKRTKDLKLVFSESSRACLGGTYHGAVEGYFIEKNIIPEQENVEVIKNEVATICGKNEDYKRPQDYIECSHGLGHAVMYLLNYDLPMALDYCDAIESKNARELCYTGVFMSNGDSFGNSEHPTKYVKEDDLLYPCNIIKKQQQGQCYSYGTLTRFQYDLPKSIEICLSIPEEFQEECFKTIGRDRTMISADPIELKNQCSQIKKYNFREDCIIGTSYNLVVRFGTESNIPAHYCDITDTEFKESCYSNMFSAMKKVSPSEISQKTFCHKIENTNYQNQCLNKI